MAIVINGSGTVTGISVGGLPDGIVDDGTLANDVVVSTSGAITTTGAFTSIGIDDNADANAITIDSSENVGIGVTPESWHSSYTALQVGGTGSIFAHLTQAAGSDLHINQNAYYDNAWRYIVTDEATNFVTNDGQFRFRVAASGTADAAISWTTAMTIANDGDVTVDTGNLVIGTAGKGIDFSAQTATATGTTASEVLDHYEEGTWTATTTTTGTPFTTTDNTTTSKYTKIGNQVTVFFNPVIATPTLGTGDVRITGLPFASNVTTTTSAMRWGRYDLHSSASFSPAMEGEPWGAVLATGSEIYIYYNSHYDNPTAYPASGLNGNATPYCAGSLTYTTD